MVFLEQSLNHIADLMQIPPFRAGNTKLAARSATVINLVQQFFGCHSIPPFFSLSHRWWSNTYRYMSWTIFWNARGVLFFAMICSSFFIVVSFSSMISTELNRCPHAHSRLRKTYWLWFLRVERTFCWSFIPHFGQITSCLPPLQGH